MKYKGGIHKENQFFSSKGIDHNVFPANAFFQGIEHKSFWGTFESIHIQKII